ncbi:MAG: zinc ribbon domain-containing protein [Phycisphaerae bacterium]
MPVFEFHCPSCERDFEEYVRVIKDAHAVACPTCGAQRVQRKLSVFAARAPQPSVAPPGPCGRCGDPNGPCGM